MKTDKKALQGLYDRFAELLIETLDNGKAVVDKETGELVRVTPDAATLNVVRQFLKDTNTNIIPGNHKATNDLATKLPFSGAEEDYADHSVN